MTCHLAFNCAVVCLFSLKLSSYAAACLLLLLLSKSVEHLTLNFQSWIFLPPISHYNIYLWGSLSTYSSITLAWSLVIYAVLWLAKFV